MIGLYGCSDPNKKLKLQKYKSDSITVDNYIDKIQVYHFKNNIFFPQKQPIFLDDIGIFVNGFFILDQNLEECTIYGERTLKKTLQLVKEKEDHFIQEIKTGMFNIMIINKNHIKLINDWFGIYPLYYTTDSKNNLIFSNNSDFMSQFADDIDWISITEFFKFGYILGNKTPWININKLPPGSILTYDLTKKKIKINKYHVFKPLNSKNKVKNNCIFNIKQTLIDSCNRIYSPNMNYSLGLTGGMDSRLIIANWPGNNIYSWTEISKDEDFKIVDQIIKQFYLNNHYFHKPNPKKSKELESMLEYMDPIERRVQQLIINIYPDYMLDRSKIELSGVFGEIFGGQYLWSFGGIFDKIKNIFFVNENRKKYGLEQLSKQLNKGLSFVDYKQLIQFLNKDISEKIVKNEIIEKHIQEILIEYNLDDSIDYYLSTEIFNLLNRALYFFGASSVKRMRYEQLTPYADYQLIENLLNYPVQKRFYRKLMLDLLKSEYGKWGKIPTTFSLLPPSFPYTIQKIFASIKTYSERHLKKKKLNFSEEFYKNIKKELYQSKIINKNLLDEKLSNSKEIQLNNELLFRIYIFCLWYKKYFEKNN